MEKKEKKFKNIKKFGSGKNISSLLFALLSLVLTIIAFGGLLFVQSIFKEKVTYKSVVVAKNDIMENEIITVDNAATYFEIKNMNILDTMDGSLTSVDEIIGTRTKVPMYAGEIVTAKDFSVIKKNSNNFKNPVEISIHVGDVASSDGGKIRAGDVVNIAMMFDREQLGMSNSLQYSSASLLTPVTWNSETPEESEEDLFDDEETTEEDSNELSTKVEEGIGLEMEIVDEPSPVLLDDKDLSSSNDKNYVYNYYAKYVLENVCVEKALDENGVEIAPTDTESVACILVFVIEKDQELAVNNALTNCANIRVSKVVAKNNNINVTEKETVEDNIEDNDDASSDEEVTSDDSTEQGE